MSEKIVGYCLLTIGILVIVLSALSVYDVFTKKSQPVDLFNFKGIGIDTNQLIGTSLPPQAQQYVAQNTPKNMQEIIPASLLNDTSNVFANFMLMGFVMSGGYKLASLGIMMIRPIVVKLKTKEVTTDGNTS